MKHIRFFITCVLVMPALLVMSCDNEPPASVDVSPTPGSTLGKVPGASTGTFPVTVFATGLNAPRGLKFGPDGYLYVAEAGLGGDMSTVGQAVQVIPPVGPYTGGYTGRISRIGPSGERTTFAEGLPSARNALGDILGVADVEFRGEGLYALVAGGGSSHGFLDVPASVARVRSDGAWSVIADLSSFQQNNPVAQAEEEDFEPDGSWYSMVKADDNLYAVEPNHGELVRVNPESGSVSRVADISATQGHIVPTAMVYHRGHFYVGNLNTFPIVPGSSRILSISKSGKIATVATGFTTILGLAVDRAGRLYVLESSTAPGFPSPGTGRVVRVNRKGANETIVEGLFLPTGMTLGPDGNLYISNKGFGPPIPGFGEILKIVLPPCKESNDTNEDEQD